MVKEKMMSYEEKSVGSTAFFICEVCPYMALAEDDIKFHLFTVHPELAKTNGLAANIQIPCPGCTSVFDAEKTLRTHLRNHHKMGIKDIKKMVKSLIQIALKNAKLKKEEKVEDPQPIRQEVDLEMPQVIEITSSIVNTNCNLPKRVAYISVEELNKMNSSNFEMKMSKEIIQEASLNIVYANDVSRSFISVSEAGPSVTQCNLIKMSVPPDLIPSIQPHVTPVIDNKLCSPQVKEIDLLPMHHNPQHILKPEEFNQDVSIEKIEAKKEVGITCTVNACIISLKEDKNIVYHRKCHQNGKLVCPECARICTSVELLHTHLWRSHSIDLELPTCQECGYKTYKLYRLNNIHMKCHGKAKEHICPICSKTFKNLSQLSKHKVIHKKEANPSRCSICSREFNSKRRLKVHIAAVHEKLKPFKCSHCDYTSARNEELKLHLRLHTGDKPYSCNECSYRCSDHNAIRRHKKTHSKESFYKCKFCPYTTKQSTVFTAHVISNHPKANSDVHRCPYCPFKSVTKDKYVLHLSTHTDKEGIQLLVDMNNSKKLSWTIPSEAEKATKASPANEETEQEAPKPVDEIPIELYYCDSLSESMPQNYSKNFCPTPAMDAQQTDCDSQTTNLSKDSNSDCLISESSTMDCRQYPQQLPVTYDNTQSNLHEFLSTSVPMEQNLNSNVNSIASNHCSVASSISNNIMSNFPIRLPLAPPFSMPNHIMLKPVDKIHMSMNKVSGPIITPTQILVPSSSNSYSPVNQCIDDGAPRKKPKISVKSNLILKGPDQKNRFHSEQKMAFRRLEDNQRFGLGSPVTFNNLISTKFMHLPPEPSLSESPDNMMPYPQETMLDEVATTPVDSEMTQNPQIFTFNQQMNVNAMTMLPPPSKIQTNDPSYIKLEATIKQNTQSPSLERMCTENLMSTNISREREYKASLPLEDINKNMSEIKNELNSDFYMPLNINDTNPSNRLTIMDQFLMDNILGEQYSGHLDIPSVVLQETPEGQSNKVIQIDDNSVDNKFVYDMNIPFESLCQMHNDFYNLDNETQTNNVIESVSDMNGMVTEVPLITQKEDLEAPEDPSCDFPNFIQGKKDPMMNTSVRLTTNKINVKNIELMKN